MGRNVDKEVVDWVFVMAIAKLLVRLRLKITDHHAYHRYFDCCWVLPLRFRREFTWMGWKSLVIDGISPRKRIDDRDGRLLDGIYGPAI